MVLPLWVVENRPSPLLWPLAYTTACTTVQAVIVAYACGLNAMLLTSGECTWNERYAADTWWMHVDWVLCCWHLVNECALRSFVGHSCSLLVYSVTCCQIHNRSHRSAAVISPLGLGHIWDVWYAVCCDWHTAVEVDDDGATADSDDGSTGGGRRDRTSSAKKTVAPLKIKINKKKKKRRGSDVRYVTIFNNQLEYLDSPSTRRQI